jgi:hypothetical protein
MSKRIFILWVIAILLLPPLAGLVTVNPAGFWQSFFAACLGLDGAGLLCFGIFYGAEGYSRYARQVASCYREVYGSSIESYLITDMSWSERWELERHGKAIRHARLLAKRDEIERKHLDQLLSR